MKAAANDYSTPYKKDSGPVWRGNSIVRKVYCETEKPFYCWLLGDSPNDGYEVHARNLHEAGQRFASSEIKRTNNTVYIQVRGLPGIYAVEPGGGTTRCAW